MTSFANQIAPMGSATTTTALAFTVTDGIGNFAQLNFIGSLFVFDKLLESLKKTSDKLIYKKYLG